MTQYRPQSSPINHNNKFEIPIQLAQHGEPHGVSGQFTAQLVVKDVQASANFYKKAFGFSDITDSYPSAAGNPEIGVMECNGLPLLLVSQKASQNLLGYNKSSAPLNLNTLSPSIITVLCKEIQSMYQQALSAGARTIQAPHQTQQGASSFLVSGMENYVWRFVDSFKGLSMRA